MRVIIKAACSLLLVFLLGVHAIASEACDACCNNIEKILAGEGGYDTATYNKSLECLCCATYKRELTTIATDYYSANSELNTSPLVPKPFVSIWIGWMIQVSKNHLIDCCADYHATKSASSCSDATKNKSGIKMPNTTIGFESPLL